MLWTVMLVAVLLGLAVLVTWLANNWFGD